MQIVTLLTDFGTADVYVAQMKAVILRAAPNCQLIDVTHQIPAQNILVGSRALRDAAMLFPEGTIHIAVVDPGVGSDRRIIAAKINNQFFILPDNGLLSDLLRDFPVQHAVALAEPRFWRPKVSHTFHGRDIIASVAGHLIGGTQLQELGPAVTDLHKLDPIEFAWLGSRAVTEIVSIDHFGNAVTSIPGKWITSLPAGTRLHFHRPKGEYPDFECCVHRTYSVAPVGEPIVLVGSHDHIELAINRGSAEKQLHLRLGQQLLVDGLKKFVEQ